MASSVRSRPTYYDMLGLSPAATEDDIKRAFAKAMGMFGAHSAAAAAQVSAAFGILRDPAKRRDYDRTIGLAPEPLPRQWGFSATAAPPPSAPGLLGSAWRDLAEQVAGAPPQAEKPLRAEEPRVASFIASSVRDPGAPLAQQPFAEPDAEAMPVGPSDEDSVAQVQRELEHILRPRSHVREAPEIEDRPFDWQRPALIAAGLLASAGVIGAFAGMSVRDNVQPAVAAAPSIGRPAGKAPTATSVTSVPAADQTPVQAPVQRQTALAPRRHKLSPEQQQQQPTPLVQEAVDQSQSAQTALDGSNSTIAADAPTDEPTAAPQAAPADLPLPKTVVARTIDRIGYACGSVVSTSGGGTPGVFTVTCSSGQTYRASPVHGRYRFSRAGRH